MCKTLTLQIFIGKANMFAVIYRFELKLHQEEKYQQCWNVIVDYFKGKRGAIGSCLHKSADGLWVAYSRWPSRAARDAAWLGDDASDEDLPFEIKQTIKQMQKIKEENYDLQQYDEIGLEVIEDKLLQY